MDGTQEYEVESVTRARVHDKKGKKITWKYYVKWKGYNWDECSWEPTDSFQGGSEHIIESFWERIDTGGRDISDSTAFKKGEELFISGPPGRKKKANLAKTQASSSAGGVSSSNVASISAPPLTTRKRRRVQITVDDEPGYSKSRHRISTGTPKNEGISVKSSKRRRISSPGPRKQAPKRMPSAGDSQLDADGETDPDVAEVEDELMQVGAEDVGGTAGEGNSSTADGSPNGSKKIAFDDLEHFYSGNPIDIDQSTDEQAVVQRKEAQPRLQPPHPIALPPPDDAAPESQAPASPIFSSPDPLFDSPSRVSDKASEVHRDSVLPHHRARAANPLVKIIDATTPESTNKQSRITAKARLMSVHAVEAPSTSSSSRNTAKRGGKSGPDRSSSGLITKNRSSLLTAAKGALKSVKGKFTGTIQRDQPDEIEEAPDAPRATGEDAIVDQEHQTMSNSQLSPPPSGDELLKLAGLQTDPETLPDYEDDPAAQLQEVEEMRETILASTPAKDELLDKSSVGVTEGGKTSDHITDAVPSVPEAGQQTPTPVVDDHSVPSAIAPPADEVVKKSIELAKEHLFPSTQTPFNSFSNTQSSFRSTIFGPLYQGSTARSAPVAKNEFSTTFKVILGDSGELPLVLKDCSEIKAQISDIQIGNSSSSKVALFYSAEDAFAMVSTFKSDGTARVVLDPSAETTQQECFTTFLRRFESSQTLIAPVGKEVCVLYSSENGAIAEKLGAPPRLKGLSSTLLISRASIENQLAYVAAVMKATAV